MNDVSVMSDERVAQIRARQIDYSDIPKLTEEFLSHCTIRFPNVSSERLNGIRALLDRTGLEKITPDNLDLAKKRWQEAEDKYDELCKAKAQVPSSESTSDDASCNLAAASG